MAKRASRARRRTSRSSVALRSVRRTAASPLARLLDSPHLARVVPHLAPETLHQLIRHCGLDACGEIVASATPAQLTSVLDLDLWRSAQPGPRRALRRGSLRRMARAVGGHRRPGRRAYRRGHGREPRDRRALPLRPRLRPGGDRADHGDRRRADGHRRDAARRSRVRSGRLSRACDQGRRVGRDRRAAPRARGRPSRPFSRGDAGRPTAVQLDAGGRRARRPAHWSRNSCFHDVALDREHRRSQQGYSTPADARAFLQMARQRRRPSHGEPSVNPLVAAYFRAADDEAASTDDAAPDLPRAPWIHRLDCRACPRRSTPSSSCSPRRAWCRSDLARCSKAPTLNHHVSRSFAG